MNDIIKWIESHPLEAAALVLLAWYWRNRSQAQADAGPQQLQEINVPNVKYEALY